MVYWLNGQPCESISLLDRSFQYGDGCFTTMLTREGELDCWLYHRERMQACLDTLAIAQPNWQVVEQWLRKAALHQPLAGLKLHISRGEGGRGYSATQVSAPNVTISDFAFPQHYHQWQREGIKLGVCQTRLGLMPLLAGHKHNNRLEQVLVKTEIDQRQLTDGVVLNLSEHVIETSMANLFWRQGDTLFTPSLAMSGVAGVARRRVLEYLEQSQVNVRVGEFALADLLAAEEVFITNSILGAVPVKGIEGQSFPFGELTRSIQEMLSP
ncbi:aminodeoxychorismate lyase [Vibrio panuliri]